MVEIQHAASSHLEEVMGWLKAEDEETVQMFDDGGDVDIVEVKPSARRQGLGVQLLAAAVDSLRQSGAKYVDVECTSQEGEALCRRCGFEDYTDPRNQRNEWDNPTLRLYLSDWRPAPPHPWA